MQVKFVIHILVVLSVSFIMASRAQAGGPEVYKKMCFKCHGAEGKGDGPAAKLLKIPNMGDLTDREAMAKYSDEDLFKLIAEGGKALGLSKVMPAYKSKLSETEIKALLSYVKTLSR